jgi:hypothetical protein
VLVVFAITLQWVWLGWSTPAATPWPPKIWHVHMNETVLPVWGATCACGAAAGVIVERVGRDPTRDRFVIVALPLGFGAALVVGWWWLAWGGVNGMPAATPWALAARAVLPVVVGALWHERVTRPPPLLPRALTSAASAPRTR